MLIFISLKKNYFTSHKESRLIINNRFYYLYNILILILSVCCFKVDAQECSTVEGKCMSCK